MSKWSRVFAPLVAWVPTKSTVDTHGPRWPCLWMASSRGRWRSHSISARMRAPSPAVGTTPAVGAAAVVVLAELLAELGAGCTS